MNWFLLLLLPTIAFAKIKSEKVVYEKDGVKMEGYLTFDDKYKNPRPGVLVFPDWMGLRTFDEEKANDLARQGYVAFAADVYGQGVRPKDGSEAAEMAGKLKADRKLLRARAQAAFDTLTGRKEVSKDRVAAIGFCFGGTTALELARSGTNFKALVSFHGGLSTDMPGEKFSPKLLLLHGADDPYVKDQEVLDFQAEVRKAKADWQFISYSNTVHSFTNPEAGNDNSKGAAYNKTSSDRAFKEMKSFLTENL